MFFNFCLFNFGALIQCIIPHPLIDIVAPAHKLHDFVDDKENDEEKGSHATLSHPPRHIVKQGGMPMGLWIADEERGLLCPGTREPLCPAPQALCLCGNAAVCAGARGARVFALDTAREVAAYPLPPCPRRLCALPGALYCLSGEADSLSLLCPMTGQLRLCVRAGCDPRDLALSPGCRLLAAAGGAAGKLLLFDSPDLKPVRAISLPGVVYSVCFRGAELMALCAIENGDISACLYRVSVRGVVTEVMRLPGLPGALLPLPDGGLLVGALGGLSHLRPDGRLLRRYPCALPARLRLYGGWALCADPLDGRLLRVPLREGRPQTLYEGGAPVDGMETDL